MKRGSMHKSERELRAWMVAQVGRTIGEPEASIDTSSTFSRFGIDSVQTLELVTELSSWLGTELDPVVLFEYPNIDALAKHLSESGV